MNFSRLDSAKNKRLWQNSEEWRKTHVHAVGDKSVIGFAISFLRATRCGRAIRIELLFFALRTGSLLYQKRVGPEEADSRGVKGKTLFPAVILCRDKTLILKPGNRSS